MDERLQLRLEPVVYAVSVLPPGFPDEDRFRLYVRRSKTDEQEGWVVVRYMYSSPNTYLCRDGKWRMGLSDYDVRFRTKDEGAFTDEDWKRYAEVTAQFNKDRFMTLNDATDIAHKVVYASNGMHSPEQWLKIVDRRIDEMEPEE